MENYSYSSYPDSVNSSPRSREIDSENASWDDQQPSNYKVKFMCSYGGKIHPRPHDNQLTYVGGETKILSVDRSIRFSNLVAKLSSINECDVCFKYQLPGEDLDALISVTNDEDLEHMILEYDRLYRGSVKPARLRLFLFPLSNTPATSAFGSTDSKAESQWFVDALNSVQLQNLDVNSPSAVSSTPVAGNNPDFLFGLEKGQVTQAPPVVKLHEQTPTPPLVPEHVVGDTVISPASDYQRQVHEMQRLQQQISNQEQAMLQQQISNQEQAMLQHQISNQEQAMLQQQISNQEQAMLQQHISNQEQAMLQQHISNQEQAMYNRKIHEGYYQQQKAPPPTQQAVTMTNTAAFWPERHMTTGPYPATQVPTEAPVYIVQTPSGVYQTPAIRPVSNQVGGQAYYGMQRVVSEAYGGGQPQPPKMGGGAYTSESIGMARAHAPAEPMYTQVGYDSRGRQVYYTAPPGVVQQQSLQHPAAAAASAAAAAGVDVRQSGGALNPEARTIGKP